MAFYGLKFGETAVKHQPMKGRDECRRTFLPAVTDAPRRRPHFVDPAGEPKATPLTQVPQPLQGDSVSQEANTNGANRPAATPTHPPPIGANKSEASAPHVAPTRREVALVFQLPSASKEKEIFDRVDFNGNGMLSLAELDKAVVELWPRFNNKPAIMRAYKASDANNTGFISRGEFALFLRFLVRFTEVWCLFVQMDKNGDRKLSVDEFIEGAHLAGLNKSNKELRAIFDSMDTNRGGAVLFDEFCAHIADAEIREAREALKLRTRAKVKKPQKVEFLVTPATKELRKLFDQLDVNRNGVLSLAELDKAVVELWPQFNNKPALMRAYKAADLNGNGLLGRKEFTAFLEFLVVFQNLWQRFEKMDENGDRRLSLAEFLQHAPSMSPYDTKSRAELERIFAKLDTNGGGFVLFDEFCSFAAVDVLQEYLKEKNTRKRETEAAKGVRPPAEFAAPPCALLCHICGKFPADHASHVAACCKDYNSKMKAIPSFLRHQAPTMTAPLPRNSQDVARYNTAARMVLDACSTMTCPECSKPFGVSQFLGHFKTHNISYNRKMELQKMAALQRPHVENLVLPQPAVKIDPEDVILDIKLQCVSPFDLSKLNALRRQLYIHRVRTPEISADELLTVLQSCAVRLPMTHVRALLGDADRGSVSSVMAALDGAGCGDARREHIRQSFKRHDIEDCDSVEYRQLMSFLPSEALKEMFARPLEKHVSRREFEGILSDLSVLYRRDEDFFALFDGGDSGKALTDAVRHRIRITHVSGEVKTIEISAPTPIKLDRGSLVRRLSLLGVTDIQKLEVVK